MSYSLQMVPPEITKEDVHVELGPDLTLALEKDQISNLIGTKIDYYETPMESRFTFHNANGMCGCGRSFFPTV